MAQWLYTYTLLFVLLLLILDSLGFSHDVNEAIRFCNNLENTCYEAKYVNNPMTWEDAIEECQKERGMLPGMHLEGGNISSIYVSLLHGKGTWVSHEKEKSEAPTCFIHKTDKHGRLRSRKRECHKKHAFVCLYSQGDTGGCPPRSWVYCPQPLMKVSMGDNLTLRCEHINPFENCEWRLRTMIFRSSSYSFDSDPRVSVVNGTSCELNIPLVKKELLGQWHCQGYRGDYVTVTLVKDEGLKQPILWVNGEVGSNARIHENNNNTVTCKAYGDNVDVHIVLMHDGESRVLSMTADRPQRSTIIGTAALRHMDAAIVSNDVKVVCRANSSNRNSSRTTHLDLLYPPRINEAPNKISSVVGQRLEYTLKFRANPKPSYVYLDIMTPSTEHVRLYPGNHYYMTHKYELSDLKTEDSIGHQYKVDVIFHQLQVNDSNNKYWFVVKNEEGEAKINFTIHYEALQREESQTDVKMEYLVEEEEVVKKELSGASTAAILLTLTVFVFGFAVIAAIYSYSRRKARMRREKLKNTSQLNVKDTTDENYNKAVDHDWNYEEQMDQLLFQEPNCSSQKP